MISHPLLAVTLSALFGVAAFAQNAEDPLPVSRPLPTEESRPSIAQNASGPPSLLEIGRDKPGKTGSEKKNKSELKKTKGPTEITALEATFDQKANLAVFIGEVVVKDPEFNVSCDRLTAYLKSDKSKGDVPPKPASGGPSESAPKKKGGGLEKAVAESTGDRRVVITQEKMEADGTITKSLGEADKATYDASTGDVVLTGSPEVLQGINRVVAVDPNTVMTLNRDGRMRANGLTKSTIVDKPESGL